METPKRPEPIRIIPRRIPEWVRRMKAGRLPAKDYSFDTRPAA